MLKNFYLNLKMKNKNFLINIISILINFINMKKNIVLILDLGI